MTVCVCHLSGKDMAPGCTKREKVDRQCDVLLWNLGPGIHMDVKLICITYLNIVAEQEHRLLVMIFQIDRGLYQQDSGYCYSANMFKNGLQKMIKSSVYWHRLQILHMNINKHLWDVLHN